MHETDQIRSSPRGHPSTLQDEYQAVGPELTATINLTPSSSRPPPAHPILKKPRGPSNSGPRPTARFVDVPDSEEETSAPSSSSQQSGTVSQSDTPTKSRATSSRSRSPAKSDKKSATGKKFIASTSSSKRRPVLPRRQSSQSSTGSAGSDVASRDVRQGTSQGSNSSSRDNSPSRRQGTPGPSTHVEGQGSKNKAPEKRSTAEATTEKRSATRPSPQFNARIPNAMTPRMMSSPLSQEHTFVETPIRQKSRQESTFSMSRAGDTQSHISSTTEKPAATTRATDSTEMNHRKPEARSEETPVSTQAGNGGTRIANGTSHAKQPTTPVPAQSQPDSNGAPPMVRSKSNTESKRISSTTAPAASFKSPSVVGMSSVAVTGGFDFETPRARLLEDELPVLGADQPDIRKPSVLDSRFTPTQPSSAAPPPMARSKSQLTLLLERDKARIGDKHRVASSSSLHKNDGKSDTKKPAR